MAKLIITGNPKEEYRRCTKCAQIKNLTEFYTHPYGGGGYQSACKECCKVKSRKYYQDNIERVKERERAKYAVNPQPYIERARLQKINNKGDVRYQLSRMLERIKQRAKNSELECNLSLDYLHELFDKQEGRCLLTGRELRFGTEDKGLAAREAASLDRIEQELGYVEGNVRFVCYQANVARGRFDDVDLVDFCCAVYELFHKDPNSFGIPLTLTEVPVRRNRSFIGAEWRTKSRQRSGKVLPQTEAVAADW